MSLSVDSGAAGDVGRVETRRLVIHTAQTERNAMTKLVLGATLVGVVMFGVFGAGFGNQRRQTTMDVIGFGLESCGKYVEARDEERRRGRSVDGVHYLNWVGGFMSGANWSAIDAGRRGFIKGHDTSGLLAWLDNHCRENPLDSFFTASTELAIHLIQRTRSE